jgi:hypothetical protein
MSRMYQAVGCQSCARDKPELCYLGFSSGKIAIPEHFALDPFAPGAVNPGCPAGVARPSFGDKVCANAGAHAGRVRRDRKSGQHRLLDRKED